MSVEEVVQALPGLAQATHRAHLTKAVQALRNQAELADRDADDLAERVLELEQEAADKRLALTQLRVHAEAYRVAAFDLNASLAADRPQGS